MRCTNCENASNWPGTVAARTYTPACLWCGARLIQALGKLRQPREEIAERRRKVLADWMAHGHSEADLRELAKGEALPLAPESSELPRKRGG